MNLWYVWCDLFVSLCRGWVIRRDIGRDLGYSRRSFELMVYIIVNGGINRVLMVYVYDLICFGN